MDPTRIALKNVRVHNLKGIDLSLEHGRLIVFTGVSGSGKSSLAFDTIYAEGQRRYIESLSTFARRRLNNFPKPDVEEIVGISPTIAIEQKTAGHNPRSTVGTMTGIYDFLRVLYARVATIYCPITGERISPLSVAAMIGLIQQHPEGSQLLVLAPYAHGKKATFKEEFAELQRRGFTRLRIDGNIVRLEEISPLDPTIAHDVDLVVDRITVRKENSSRIAEAVQQAVDLGHGTIRVLAGQEEAVYSTYAFAPQSGVSYPPLEPHDFSFNHPAGMCPECQGLGIVHVQRAFHNKHICGYVEGTGCPACHGARIRPYPAAACLQEKSIAQVTALSIQEALVFFTTLALPGDKQAVGEQLVREIVRRLHFLQSVGLHYLSLNRTAPTLSGGEAHRVRLASQVCTGLVGATYVLDEPSIGLHPADHRRLIDTLRHLRDQGNTVIVVEHDRETMLAADEIVDIGPGAGAEGGEIVIQGTWQQVAECPRSLTGDYLSGRRRISVADRKRIANKYIKITQANHHNLKNIDVAFPLGMLTAVTGVSGSGKSSLISGILYPALANRLHRAGKDVGNHGCVIGWEAIDKVIGIDQTPIGRTPRSTPATYIKVFDEIRDLFSTLPESVARGFQKGRFSFNMKTGSCPHCTGMGMVCVDMDFLEDAWVPCEYCVGQRFDEGTLSIRYKGKTISDVLNMPIGEAVPFFSQIPTMQRKLSALLQVGLGYMHLGQSSPTLSGGEAQRIKLAKALVGPATGKTLYILDEPTTGLHFHDISQLVSVLQALVEKGNSVIVIEHNTDFLRSCDWIIDLGPTGGAGGGYIVGVGRPEEIATIDSPTGHALDRMSRTPGQHSDLSSCHNRVFSSSSISYNDVAPIFVEGARQNTLKNISAVLPRNQIIVCTGPSGSGKSSFAFDTVYAEGQRRYVESMSLYARQFIRPMPKPLVDRIEGLSPAIAIEQSRHAGNLRSTVGTLTEVYDYLRILYTHLGTPYCPETGESLHPICADLLVDEWLQLPLKTKIQVLVPLYVKSEEQFLLRLDHLRAQGYSRIRFHGTYYDLDEHIPYAHQAEDLLFLVVDRIVLSSTSRLRLLAAIENAATMTDGQFVAEIDGRDRYCNLAFAVSSTGKAYPPITPHTFSFNTPQGMCPICSGLGIQGSGYDHVEKTEQRVDTLRVKITKRDKTQVGAKPNPFISENLCPACHGSRLHPFARSVSVEGKTLPALCALPMDESYSFLLSLRPSADKQRLLGETLCQIRNRLAFLLHIGVGYIALDRSAPTLSGGEMQRIRLARQLGSGLTGSLYVLDEPTIGLHPADTHMLNQALCKLKEMGNTLLLVEHDPQTLQLADYLLEFGPGAGRNGGQIIAAGTLSAIQANPKSLTGAYLSGRKRIPIPKERKTSAEKLIIEHATLHNLQDLYAEFPIGAMSCITGVSGSGKSTLLSDLLAGAARTHIQKRPSSQRVEYLGAVFHGFHHFDAVLVLEQDPIGHTQRADVSTYIGLLSSLRHLYSCLPLAQAKGLQPCHFSPNHAQGMCTACQGLGMKTISLQFLPPVHLRCEACQGFRLHPLALQVQFRGKHLGQTLQLTVTEAREFLAEIPKAVRCFDTLINVGLGYVRLDQAIATLSGGEAQRLRLAKELAKLSSGKTLYLFDEPTVGLHSEDILLLLSVLRQLIQRGDTVILIEHNLDVIANADYLLDLGPGAGVAGGKVVGRGVPEVVAMCPTSPTAPYLAPILM